MQGASHAGWLPVTAQRTALKQKNNKHDHSVARLWSQDGHRRSGDGSHPPGSSGGAIIYTNNLQLSNAFLLRFVAESILHLTLYTAQKTLDLRESHEPTRLGQGGCLPLTMLLPNTGTHTGIKTYQMSPYSTQTVKYKYTYAHSLYTYAHYNIYKSLISCKTWRWASSHTANGKSAAKWRFSLIFFKNFGLNATLKIGHFWQWVPWGPVQSLRVSVWQISANSLADGSAT